MRSHHLLSPSLNSCNGSKPIYAYVLQIIVVANHMSGKDTHIRGLKVLGPIECAILDFFLSNNR